MPASSVEYLRPALEHGTGDCAILESEGQHVEHPQHGRTRERCLPAFLVADEYRATLAQPLGHVRHLRCRPASLRRPFATTATAAGSSRICCIASGMLRLIQV